MSEVELGQLAAQRASDPQVKQFAQRMVTDHGKANDELKQIAARKNVQLPADIPAGLSDAFSGDAGRQAQWRAFLTRNRLEGPALPELVDELRARLMPVLDQARGLKANA